MSVRSELRQEAMLRDGGMCVWPRCYETGYLQMAHLQPSGSGGKDIIENVAMMCRFHHDMHDGREPRKLREYRNLWVAYMAQMHGYDNA